VPRPPRSPLDIILDNLRDAVLDTVEDLSETAREYFERNVQEAARAVPKPKKRIPGAGTGGRGRKAANQRAGERMRPRAQERQERTLYEVLEVSRNASHETISAAFRSLSRRYHPDNKETGDEKKFKEISHAWTVLKDDIKRRDYDRVWFTGRGMG